jgi:hypothetical protein
MVVELVLLVVVTNVVDVAAVDDVVVGIDASCWS